MKPRIISSPYPQPWIKNAVELIINTAQEADESHGRFSLVLSGGTTPEPVYQALADPLNAARIDWSRTYIFWGDERAVTPDHPESNYRMAKEALLEHVRLPEDHIFRIQGELPPAEAANIYQHQLKEFFPGAVPDFDLILLGLGTDGHTASLFPESQALSETRRWAAANFAPSQQTWRVTLTFPALLSARRVVFLVRGGSKAEVLRDVISHPQASAQYPAARIASQHPDLTWILDQASASLL